ncbi:hypothetical protein EV368DRAFT_82870 [Lentinula lateritia]|uniref:Uncharacterized protein n=1 Tax=Lentinula aff. lateritia TaxID=2804960 RepID=A0ACC1TZF4_9AGAR|nr:hypothetical protein F5876DRAFT_77067 [Lentinula aff. lateritia]KAJ3852085.1 hypothetical protein EV368DRAFT_82870 [Lentinula lateritia]
MPARTCPSFISEQKTRIKCSHRPYATDIPLHHGSEVSYSPEKLLQALEMMADSSESLPPIPSGQDQESFWRAYLLANQIIMYLAARPPTEAETFAAIFQSASVPENSAIARGRAGVLKITKQIVKIMREVTPSSSLRSSHSEVFQAFENLQKTHDIYVAPSEENVNDMEKWSRFFVGLRTDLVEFTARIGTVVEEWESVEQQMKK